MAALCAAFGAALGIFWDPMSDQIYDLSMQYWESEAVPEDWVYDQKGWAVFTQEGDERRELEPNGWGGFSALEYPGQTFYFSRAMTEDLDSPSLRLGGGNRTFSVLRNTGRDPGAVGEYRRNGLGYTHSCIEPLGNEVGVAVGVTVDCVASQSAVQVHIVSGKELGDRGRDGDSSSQTDYHERVEWGEGNLQIPPAQVYGQARAILIFNGKGLPQHGTGASRQFCAAGLFFL